MIQKTVLALLGLTALFLVLYHYKSFTDVVTSVSNSVSGTIKRLQKGA